MRAFLSFAVIGFGVLCLIYWLVSLYARSRVREGLERAADGQLDPEAYIAEGLRDYARSLRKRLLVLVILVPVGVVICIVYLMNYT
ncbi:hypothetical protein [Thioclava sp. GXIMD4216]|uniref:hypothetical protein n=1 Tax=unclassified Thioclava TaxID=2621713 RepID=UPI0030CAE6D8